MWFTKLYHSIVSQKVFVVVVDFWFWIFFFFGLIPKGANTCAAKSLVYRYPVAIFYLWHIDKEFSSLRINFQYI